MKINKTLKIFAIALSLIFFPFFCLSSEEDFVPGVFYAKKISGNVSLSNNITLNNGYSYVANGPCKIKTTEQSEAELILCNNILLNVLPKTDVSIDMLYISIKNLNNPPEKIQYSFSISQFSLLSGKVQIYVPPLETNSHVIIQTPLCVFNISSGKYFIDTGPMHVIIGVLDGDIEIITDKKKVEKVISNNLALIIPHPGKESRILVTQKPLTDEEKSHKNNLSEDKLKNVLFAIVDKKIIGIGY